jgi:uncharacterized protein YndB with AHSA1/START domain
MNESSVIHHTFVLERSYAVGPERAFAAFADPAKKRRWSAEGEHHEVERFEMDFRVGGREYAGMRFGAGTPFPGTLFEREASYQDIVQDRRIVIASSMSLGGRRISVSLETFEFLPAGAAGTDMIFTHQAVFFEGSDGPQMREAGWEKLLGKLAGEVH